MASLTPILLISLSLLQYFSGSHSTTLTIQNNCNDIIWPVVLSNPSSQPLSGPSGFTLGPGASKTLPGPVPAKWSGRVWARTHCTTNSAGQFTCATGDCTTASVDCSAGKLTPPATAAEFSTDTFTVSVVDGYNLPVVISAGICGGTGCAIDSASAVYPPELRETTGTGNATVGIKSACSAFDQAEYCCTGGYSSASNCKANSYSALFKKWCPRARTFAYDTDGTEFPCSGADYVINFCVPLHSGGSPPVGTGAGTGYIPDNNSGDYGKSNTDSKFGIIIGVVVAALAVMLLLYFWQHRCWKSDCKMSPCSCTCCSIFTCSCCMDDSDSDNDKCGHH